MIKSIVKVKISGLILVINISFYVLYHDSNEKEMKQSNVEVSGIFFRFCVKLISQLTVILVYTPV